MRTRHITVFALLGSIWGSEWLATRSIDLPPLAGIAIRYAIAASVLAAIIAARRIRRPELRPLMLSAASGITFAMLPTLLATWASHRVSPGLMVVLLAMTPLIAALLEGRASGMLLGPLVGGVAGTALLASQGLSFASAQWTGALAVLVAAALIAASVIYVRRELSGMPLLWLAAVQLAAAATCIAAASLVVEGRSALIFSWRSSALEVVLGILGGALGLPVYYWLLRRLESFELTASQWLVTVVGVVEGLLLVGTMPSWRISGGAAIVLASVWTLLRMRPDEDAPLTIELTLPHSDG